MTTSSVSYTVPSNSWTGSIDVTNCDLSTDISVFDVRIFYNGTEQGLVETANWSKVSVTSLSYSGSSLNLNDVVRIERETPATQIVTVLPLQTISSGAWNAEFTRIYNILEEQRTFGLPDNGTVISDEIYGAGWNGITSQAPSKNAIYDKINALSSGVTGAIVEDDVYGSGWNGDTTHAPSQNAVYDKIEAVTGGASGTLVEDAAYSSGWDGDTTHAPSQNAVYDILSSTITSISDNRNIGTMNGRLTVSSGTPIVDTNTSSSTLYYTPHIGNNIYLYSGTAWIRFTLTEVSIALSGLTTGRPYDVFIYNSGGLTLQLVQWSSASTRSIALTLQDGVPLLNGFVGRRYLGTIVPISNTIYQGSRVATANEVFYNTVYNYYNKIQGTYVNSQNVNLTSTGGIFPWYSNAGYNFVHGYYDDADFRLNLSAGFTNTTGATRQIEIYTYSNTLTASLTAAGDYLGNGTSGKYHCASGLNAASTLGYIQAQPVYFTDSASITEDFGRAEFVFSF